MNSIPRKIRPDKCNSLRHPAAEGLDSQFNLVRNTALISLFQRHKRGDDRVLIQETRTAVHPAAWLGCSYSVPMLLISCSLQHGTLTSFSRSGLHTAPVCCNNLGNDDWGCTSNEEVQQWICIQVKMHSCFQHVCTSSSFGISFN